MHEEQAVCYIPERIASNATSILNSIHPTFTNDATSLPPLQQFNIGLTIKQAGPIFERLIILLYDAMNHALMSLLTEKRKVENNI